MPGLFEIRVYEPHEGCADAVFERFCAEAMPRMAEHGIQVLGVFKSAEDDGSLTYITRFASETARAQAWKAFAADPEWQKAKAASETNGPLLRNQTVTILKSVVPGLQFA